MIEDTKLLEFYFQKWKTATHSKQQKCELTEQREKLENLLSNIKRYKKERKEQKTNYEVKRCNKSTKNRLEAQKSAIEKLTDQLKQKERLIDELKLGIFNREALSEPRLDIREIFADCSVKVRCKIPPPVDLGHKFMVSTQKAPKIVQEMEERALIRLKRREIILERKHQIEENKRRMIAEALERKRVQEEGERKESLEKIKERRRLEMEKHRIRQANKLIFLEKLQRAIDVYNRKLLNTAFKSLLFNCLENKSNLRKSDSHCRRSILGKALKNWKELLEDKYKEKYALADAVHAHNLLSKALTCWIEVRVENIRSMQVAQDFYDLLLTNNTFVHWHRYVCVQIMDREKKMRLATNHFDRRLLFNSFYQWRSLPAINQLEKSKEMKLKKWREKVWSILPDYKPAIDY